MRKLTAALATSEPLGLLGTRDRHLSLDGFNTARVLAIASSVLIALICGIAAVTIYEKFARSLIYRDAMITMALTQAISDYHGLDEAAISERSAGHFPESDHEAVHVAEFFERISRMPEVMRANIYAPDGTVVWSSSLVLVGQQFAGNSDLIDALRGEVVAELSNRNDKGKREYSYFDERISEFVEYYFPIWDRNRGKIIAVAEIYKSPSSLLNTIRSGMVFIWGAAILAGGAIYAALLWVIWRACGIMRRQQEHIIESETLAVVGEMASVLAHGIRNPLTSIRTSAEVAMEEEDGEAVREAMHDIVTEADRLERWVRELLKASAVRQAHPRKLDITLLLRDCLGRFAPRLERQGISCTLDAPGAVPLICGDPPLLEQALMNLLANAAEAMPDGGVLTIRVKQARLGAYLELAVSDTGAGIDRDRLGKIFKPFFTTKKSGTGLGLPLTRRIVERHGGSLEISSEEGEGTTVLVRFPLEEGPCPQES